MRYLIVEWNTKRIIEEFKSEEARAKWVRENCYPSQDMKAFYWINGDVRIEFMNDYEDVENKALKDIDNYVQKVCGGWL